MLLTKVKLSVICTHMIDFAGPITYIKLWGGDLINEIVKNCRSPQTDDLSSEVDDAGTNIVSYLVYCFSIAIL